MTNQLSDNKLQNNDELTFYPSCTEYQITDAQYEKYGCCVQCASSGGAEETPEEREAFERIEKRNADAERQNTIARMTAIALKCNSTSMSGVCARLYDAGCDFKIKQQA